MSEPATGDIGPLPRPRWPARLRSTLTMAVYHAVFAVGFLFYGPALAWKAIRRPDYRRGFRERFGQVERSRPGAPVVWVHGVSVGEVKAAATVIAEIEQRFPDLEIVVSSTTPTGNRLARQLQPKRRVIYFPLDFAHFPWRALRRIRPGLVVLMELEIWPNFLSATRSHGIPVVVVNGRMSERSFRRYRWLRGLLPQFKDIACYCVQNETYARRLRGVSVPDERIVVTGNTKYDSVSLSGATPFSTRLRQWLAPAGELVLVCGSTHGDEDRELFRAVRECAVHLGNPIRMVTVPRHPERSGAVADALAAEGARCVAWSGLDPERLPSEPRLAPEDVVVVDTIGLLEGFYLASDVAFVGGSLVPHGGQNMIEPAALGRAVVFGPHTDNFRKDVQNLLAVEGAVQTTTDRLVSDLVELFDDSTRRAALGERARELIERSRGATQRTIAHIAPLLRRFG